MTSIPLRQLARNQSGRITAVSAEGDLGKRIRDLGLLPGVVVTAKGKAPLFDPLALSVKGYILTLRNGEADHISVEPLKRTS